MHQDRSRRLVHRDDQGPVSPPLCSSFCGGDPLTVPGAPTLGAMPSATALSIVSVILIVKALLIGWVTWGRAQMLGAVTAARTL